MIRTFVSYHHANDQDYKDAFVIWAKSECIVEDMSVSTGDIDDQLDSQSIRRIIRDQYLRDSQVTVLLSGKETRFRKHVDWELKSTMIDGRLNRRSGILVIDLPTSSSNSWYAAYENEKAIVYPDYTDGWRAIETTGEFEGLYPEMPRRVLYNLVAPDVKISIVPWERIYGYPDRARFLLSATALQGPLNRYDLSHPMRRKNFNPRTDYVDLRT